MTLRLPDGSESPEFTMDQMRSMASTMRETDDDRATRDKVHRVTGDELRAFIERIERLAAEKAEIADQIALVYAEAKARGYDTKTMRRIVALRKRSADEVAEENAVLDLYLEAIGL